MFDLHGRYAGAPGPDEPKKKLALALVAAGASIDLIASTIGTEHAGRPAATVLIGIGCACLVAAFVLLIQARKAS